MHYSPKTLYEFAVHSIFSGMKDMDIKLLFDICSLLYLQGRAIIHTFFNPKGNVVFRFWKKGEETVFVYSKRRYLVVSTI